MCSLKLNLAQMWNYQIGQKKRWNMTNVSCLLHTTLLSESFVNYHEPRHDKTNKVTVPSENSDQLGHPPSLIRVFAVRRKKARVLSYPLSAQQRLWSGRTCHFVCFVTRWLIYKRHRQELTRVWTIKRIKLQFHSKMDTFYSVNLRNND